jgi:1-acyl-sn-glycerol-3-phosphate acyltransferase
MLYYFLKLAVGIFTRIFYRNPLLLNRENVPQDVPLIIASNHPNALCDPCSIAVLSKQRIHFLARGDVFKNKILYFIFVKHLGMVPIFRLLEGAENLHRNEETFRNTAEKLRRNKTILMFSEGICVQERRLRKLRKGTARIAFATEESAGWKLGLKIIPLGMNYNAPPEFRSDLVMNFGKPFEVSMFRESYQKDKAIAINELTKYLEGRLAELVVHIASPENDQLVAQIEEVVWNESTDPNTKVGKFRLTEKIAVKVNALKEGAATLREKMNNYFSLLSQLKTKDLEVKNLSEKKAGVIGIGFRIILALAGLPFYIFGLVNNYIPYKAGYVLARKIAKTIEFHATVHLYSSMVLYLIFYSLQIVSVALIFRNWYVLGAYIVLLPLSGLFVWEYYLFIKNIFSGIRIIALDKEEKEKLWKKRKEIISELILNFKP